MLRFLAIAVAWAVLELWSLLVLARAVGAGAALLWVLTAMGLGAMVIRRHGPTIGPRVQALWAQGELPAPAMLDGLAVMLAGLLLIIPGLFGDFLAGALLLNPVRRVVLSRLAGRGRNRDPRPKQPPASPRPGVIEGEARRVPGDRE